MRHAVAVSILIVLGACAAGAGPLSAPPAGVDEAAWRLDAQSCARQADRAAGAELERGLDRPGAGGALRADLARMDARALRQRLYDDCMVGRGYGTPG